ncbi:MULTISPECIES: P-type conjugative transfer protein TrbJ [Parvibaculum]|uniref:P-type conjugative transfer protein TrbJ n=1 Tax=Parvibaculum lavamentivorans (strain DS-1 / DSM 13023 / NCIMB 13966) TaxID=402881 RepID=A7HU73_PARL1|nr:MULTISPECIES: P-type conjugative transfer protein TrbJ [Parvibaculum]PKQ02617.1 MAG: P-type conjugative transfer protein TrbJ [Alphaproteobacteria bacterium HGW-Alphaproteobacteria-12]ABS63456.1 P-type conjugative transfer protein TrbJ [Parvibaculum lavamentivorans DS-1]MCW5726843.1 P-type conjugative transfer protein TrbJ [Parvibaculum sp.]MDP1628680.1 P-type conjugative transfer protein TrbJ [Parvibaculum sp.]MDP2150176.1 P-type conjugative transfer protein TrbJ [Parvibaculum sp.]
MTCTTLRAVLLVLCLSAGLVMACLRPAAAMTVFDPTNYVQNLLQAVRALEQIDNQIRSLQNEAVMLENMARNLERLDLSTLEGMVSGLTRIGQLMDQARGIAFTIEATQAALEQSYPERYGAEVTHDVLLADAKQRWRDAMSAYGDTMRLQAGIARNVESDQAALVSLVAASQGAVGVLQAQQAANQLLALSTKQQLQIQSLMAAQYRAEALDAARKAQAEEQARASFDRFMGEGKAYRAQ